MSNEIRRAFDALADDASRTRQTEAPTVRRRADRRRRTRAIAGVAAAAVLVTGLTVTSRVVLAGPDGPDPAPAVSPTTLVTAPPTPSTAPSPTAPRTPPSRTPPSSAPPSATKPVVPKEIPDRAFLQASDLPGRLTDPPQRTGSDDQKLIQFCDEVYDRPGKVGIRAARLYQVHPSSGPAGSTPRTTVREDVIVHRGSGSEDFMYHLREAVKACPEATDEGGVRVTFKLRGAIGAGDDSVLIERTRPAFGEDGEPVGDGTTTSTFWAAVRVGDTIGFVSNLGYESVPPERDETVALGRRAAARLQAWRG